MQGLVIVGLIVEEILNVDVKCLKCTGGRVITRILKVGVLDSLFIKSRSPSQKVGVPLPQK